MQCVVLDGETSNELHLSSGIPQWSVLGPIIFLLYINDQPDSIHSHVRLYEDDTAADLAFNGKKIQMPNRMTSINPRIGNRHGI